MKKNHQPIGVGRSTHVFRGALVMAQFAFALPLLATAALLLNSFVRLQRVDAGFDPKSLVYVHVSLPVARYGPADAISFWNRLASRLAEEPGIVAAGLNQAIPPDEAVDINNFDLVDRPVAPGDAQPTAPYGSASSGFFAAAGVPLLEGRLFTEADTGGTAPVMVVSRAWARHYSPDRSAVGRRLQGGGCTTCVPFTIIGVVGDVKYQGLSGTGEAMYVAPGQNPSPNYSRIFNRQVYVYQAKNGKLVPIGKGPVDVSAAYPTA